MCGQAPQLMGFGMAGAGLGVCSESHEGPCAKGAIHASLGIAPGWMERETKGCKPGPMFAGRAGMDRALCPFLHLAFFMERCPWRVERRRSRDGKTAEVPEALSALLRRRLRQIQVMSQFGIHEARKGWMERKLQMPLLLPFSDFIASKFKIGSTRNPEGRESEAQDFRASSLAAETRQGYQPGARRPRSRGFFFSVMWQKTPRRCHWTASVFLTSAS